MFFHQPHNTIGKNVFNACVYRSIFYDTHIHKGYELTYVLEGTLHAKVDDTEYQLTSGEALMVFPYQLHAYQADKNCLCLIVVFSESFITTFVNITKDKKSLSAKVLPCVETQSFIKKTFLTQLDYPDKVSLKKPDELALKACLYAFCNDFLCQNELVPSPGKLSLVTELILYVEKNFKTNITLRSMAKDLGYCHEHLSRVFNKTFHVNFKAFVNQYRLEFASHLIKTTKKTFLEIALESGFQSVRSFNRAFLTFANVSPSSLRK